MGDEAVTSLSTTANGIITTSTALKEEVIEPQSSSSTSTLQDEVTEPQPSTSGPSLGDTDPEPGSRLRIDSADQFVTRPRSNASDYAVNPRSPRASIDLGPTGDSGKERLQNGAPSRLNLDVTTNLTKSSLLSGSSTSVDDVKVVFEDNDDVIMESPSVNQKEFSPEVSSELSSEFAAEAGVPGEEGSGGTSGASVGSEPEPGASLEPVGRTSSGRNLLLVTPGIVQLICSSVCLLGN